MRHQVGRIWGDDSDQNFYFPPPLEATEPISLMFMFSEMFTVLKGLGMFSSPDMPVRSSSLLLILACFGVTVGYSILKLYRVTS